jgi:hypothetical protein
MLYQQARVSSAPPNRPLSKLPGSLVHILHKQVFKHDLPPNSPPCLDTPDTI